MRNKDLGITLVSLVITIIVLLILASVGTYTGINIIQSSKFTAFTTELKIMQTKVNEIYEENEKAEMGQPLENEIKKQAEFVFTEQESGINSQEGYRYWNAQYIQELGVEEIKGDYFVNLEKRSIVSYNGFKKEGKTYYTLEQLSNEQYNVEYSNPNEGKPDFQTNYAKITEEKWEINVTDIQYEKEQGYIDKWQVEYKLEEKDNWNISEELKFIVDTPGTYKIKIKNNDIESEEKTIQIVNVKLLDGMKPVYWDEEGKEVETEASDNNWYNYVAGDNETDSKESKWANAKTEDGSYFVWIPRYEYKTIKENAKSDIGKTEVKFIPKTQTVADEGYTIHPAFINGKNNNYQNGEWDNELAGIWVAKYEISMQTNGSHTETVDETVGNIEIENNEQIKMASKPIVSSWRNINIGNAYKNCLQYDKNKESHLMKDSEWGAVAYLTNSQYGRNENKVEIDESSTGNSYGVYDLSGGNYEYVSAYTANGDISLINGSGLVNIMENNPEAYKTMSTKYVTIYQNDENNMPFVIRGGSHTDRVNAGIFLLNRCEGIAKGDISFRIVLAG